MNPFAGECPECKKAIGFNRKPDKDAVLKCPHCGADVKNPKETKLAEKEADK